MPIKRGRLIHLLSNHPNLTDKAFRHKEVADSLKFTLNDTKSKIEKEQVEDSIEFTLWNDLWNEYGTGSLISIHNIPHQNNTHSKTYPL